MVRQIPNSTAAALIAPLVGGPAFVTGIVLVELIQNFPKPIEIAPDEVVRSLGFIVFSIIPGWMAAIFPCAIGAGLMAHWGSRQLWTRHLLIWALAGFLPVPLISIAINGFTNDALLGGILFALPCILCALICRKLTSWRDPMVAVEPVVAPAVAV